MSRSRVEVTGLEELLKAMGDAPAEIKADGMMIVRETTEGAAAEIRGNYPEASHTAGGTGTLRARVNTSYPSSTVLVGIVRSQAPHAYIYEHGTGTRQTGKGYNRGVMPPHRVTPAIAVRWRARMYARLGDLLRRTGLFEVSGV